MKILVVLCQNPFTHFDGGTYAVRASLRQLEHKGELIVTGFGADFDNPRIGNYKSAGSLGEVHNSRFEFIKALVLGHSYSMEKYAGRLAQRKLQKILLENRIQVAWFDKLQSVAAALGSAKFESTHSGRLYVLRSHNVEHAILSDRLSTDSWLTKRLLKLEASRLRREEIAAIVATDYTCTISREDRESLVAELPELKERIIFLPLSAESVTDCGNNGDAPRKSVLFIGDCRWRPNRIAAEWIAEELAPTLYKACPDLAIRLVGRGTEMFSRMQANLEGVGFAERLDEEFEAALCTIAPVWHGGGVNVKVIESLAHGVPVIGSVFAKRGTDTEAYIEAETAADFVARISELKDRPNLNTNLSISARCSVTKSRKEFDDIWTQILGKAGY